MLYVCSASGARSTNDIKAVCYFGSNIRGVMDVSLFIIIIIITIIIFFICYYSNGMECLLLIITDINVSCIQLHCVYIEYNFLKKKKIF